MDALVLRASKSVADSKRVDDAGLSKALSGAVHVIGFNLSDNFKSEAFQKLKSACSRRIEIREGV